MHVLTGDLLRVRLCVLRVCLSVRPSVCMYVCEQELGLEQKLRDSLVRVSDAEYQQSLLDAQVSVVVLPSFSVSLRALAYAHMYHMTVAQNLNKIHLMTDASAADRACRGSPGS